MELTERMRAIEAQLIKLTAERESFIILVEEYKTTSASQAEHYHELLSQKIDQFIKNADCTHSDIERSVDDLRKEFHEHTRDEANDRKNASAEQKKTQRMLWAVVISVGLSLATWAFVEIDRLQEALANSTQE